jgi:hypothetical protein
MLTLSMHSLTQVPWLLLIKSLTRTVVLLMLSFLLLLLVIFCTFLDVLTLNIFLIMVCISCVNT